MTDQANPPAGNATSSTTRLSGIGLWVAIAVLVGFGVFVAFMIGKSSANETTWTRLAWLFASVEAIAFGAAGALFGSSIQRERAEQAEQKADEANERADGNAEDAAKGKALAATLKADAAAAAGGGEAFDIGAGGDPTALRHAQLATELFG
jgi:uncharacterized membrane protein YsdA (DUF1294 family)